MDAISSLPKYIQWFPRRNCYRVRYKKDGKRVAIYCRRLDDAYQVLKDAGLPVIKQRTTPEYITYCPIRNRWRVRIRIKGYDKWVSSHPTREEAIIARDRFLEKLRQQTTASSVLQFLRAS